MTPLIATAIVMLVAAPQSTSSQLDQNAAEPLAGVWNGSLETPSARIPLILRVEGHPGARTAVVDSPAQGASGLAVRDITRMQATYTITLAVPAARFTGTLSQDGRSLTGTWQQNGASLPLRFDRPGATQVSPAPR